jgi:hypothetical protein
MVLGGANDCRIGSPGYHLGCHQIVLGYYLGMSNSIQSEHDPPEDGTSCPESATDATESVVPTDSPASVFADDSPLNNSSSDMLGRAPFAQRVADILIKLPQGAGLVVGIHGPWGDGKTTVLNMIRNDLNQAANIAVLDYNPWRFTTEAGMLAGFFAELANTLRLKLKSRAEELADWVERLGRYASVIDDRFGRASDLVKEKAAPALESLRKRLANAFRESNQRIVVLIDDIDRLDKDEIHTIFRIIKACADLPNVCYVLAFDDVAVAQSLGDRYEGGGEDSGRAFLEKIIQIPLKLPIAAREDLRSLCFAAVDHALASLGLELSEEEAATFVSVFDRGIILRLDTARSAKRYGNAILFALPILSGEVNTIDLLLVEALRSFYPDIYDIVRSNHNDFSGQNDCAFDHKPETPRAIALLEPFLERLESNDREAVKTLLISLFPRLASAYNRMSYSDEHWAEWTRRRRICSPDYCSRYFAYHIHANDIRESEFNDLLMPAVTGNNAELTTTLRHFFEAGKARRIIERFRISENSIDPEAVPAICFSLAPIAHLIPNQPSFLGIGPPTQAAILIANLIRRLPEGEPRLQIARKVIEASEPLWFAKECLQWFYVTEDEDKKDANTLTQEQIECLGVDLLLRIHSASEAGEPLFNTKIRQEIQLLFSWRRMEGREPVQKHLERVFDSDTRMINEFLISIAPRSIGSNSPLSRPGDIDGDEVTSIEKLFNLDDFAKAVRKNCAGNFENPEWYSSVQRSNEVRHAEQFFYVYNKWQSERSPNDVSNAGDDATPMTDDEAD